LGVWLWASEPVEARLISLWVDGIQDEEIIKLSTTPKFYTISGSIQKSAERIKVVINPFLVRPDHTITIFFDDIVLTNGMFLEDKEIVYKSEDDKYGEWGGQVFKNLVRNPSADRNWLTIKPGILNNIREFTNLPDYAISAIQDTQFTSNFYTASAKNLFKTFWAIFGWNHVKIPPGWYYFLLGITIAGILNGFSYLLKSWGKYNLRWKLSVFWLGFGTGTIWFAAIARTSLPFWNSSLFIPAARYAYPVILPTMMIIMSGLLFLGKSPRSQKWGSFFLITILVILDIVSIFSIYRFYYQI
jgi:hypothetical protein